MEELQRVTFRFEGDTQVHYLAYVPKPGDLVSHGRELWSVSSVEVDSLGKLVICRRPPDNDPKTRR